jgi:uroporphyrin-III C-methyltransferase
MSIPTHITFAGAGPGDPGLVTVRLVNALKAAQCILVDRLVNPEILKLYAHPGAEIIFVGKQAYESESTAQSDINALLIQKAIAGINTVRLKGGDVAIYSNVLDEIHALNEAGITFEIIPGITAASGAAASLGIALTGRGIAPGLQIHTMSALDEPDDATIMSWAVSDDTLVFYMSVSRLKKLASRLLEFNADPMLPLAIIEEATGPHQVNTFYTLKSFAELNETISYKSPSIVFIGRMIHEIREKANSLINPDSIFTPVNTKTKNNLIHVI